MPPNAEQEIAQVGWNCMQGHASCVHFPLWSIKAQFWGAHCLRKAQCFHRRRPSRRTKVGCYLNVTLRASEEETAGAVLFTASVSTVTTINQILPLCKLRQKRC